MNEGGERRRVSLMEAVNVIRRGWKNRNCRHLNKGDHVFIMAVRQRFLYCTPSLLPPVTLSLSHSHLLSRLKVFLELKIALTLRFYLCMSSWWRGVLCSNAPAFTFSSLTFNFTPLRCCRVRRRWLIRKEESLVQLRWLVRKMMRSFRGAES